MKGLLNNLLVKVWFSLLKIIIHCCNAVLNIFNHFLIWCFFFQKFEHHWAIMSVFNWVAAASTMVVIVIMIMLMPWIMMVGLNLYFIIMHVGSLWTCTHLFTFIVLIIFILITFFLVFSFALHAIYKWHGISDGTFKNVSGRWRTQYFIST